MRRRWMAATLGAAAVAAALGQAAGAVPSGSSSAGSGAAADAAQATAGAEATYVVLYDEGVDAASARAAITAAGGTVIAENGAIGFATVRSSRADFAGRINAVDGVLSGAARNTSIGTAHLGGKRDPADATADLAAATAPAATVSGSRNRYVSPNGPRAERDDPDAPDAPDAPDSPDAPDAPDAISNVEPLAGLQWDMAAIGATAAGSYDRTTGRRSVVVGVIDTGIDASHTDLVDRVDRARSRNFTTDIPLIDGECDTDPDGSCADPADVDEDGHGTHVAGTIAASMNDYGIAGILPRATLVNLRAGQDSGFFFVDATVNALTYAGDIGVDVVNMSFYVDPWLYNCTANPADTATEQQEQRTIIESVQRAARYARGKGVTLIAALGNEATDLGNPTIDPTSPDYPPGAARTRTIDNSCIDVPAELDGVISVSSVGPSLRKADYSNYGIEQTDLSAPGGWFRDGFGTATYRTPANMILSTWPTAVALDELAANEGELPDDMISYCGGGVCSYYKYLQGTSMAAPHATGVAALAVSLYGHKDRGSRGWTLEPDAVEAILLGTAADRPCPAGGVQSYVNEGRPPSFDATCVGTAQRNGFYGDGIVSAANVASDGGEFVS